MVNIAVFGATGTIGSRIITEALGRGHTVTAVVRDAATLTNPDPRLQIFTGDVLEPDDVALAAQGQDVVVSAVGGGDGPGHLATIAPAARALVTGLRTLQQPPRLVTVGGAGSLHTPDGSQVWDTPGLPEQLLQIMHAHGDALDYLRTVSDVEWVNVSPAATIAPGERTGAYRTSLDQLLIDEAGNSVISAEDYAVAIIDEIDTPSHTGQRFAVGY